MLYMIYTFKEEFLGRKHKITAHAVIVAVYFIFISLQPWQSLSEIQIRNECSDVNSYYSFEV